MKIAYAGFDLLYPVLENLYRYDCEIIKIFSCNVNNVTEFNTKVAAFAKKHSIPITYDKITLDDLYELRRMGVDVLFCAAYYYRIPVIDDLKMINVHPSLLPQGRGAWPMPVYILNSMKKAGVTFHKMDKDFDSGDIIMQKAFELSDSDNLDTFMQKVYSLIPDMITDLIGNFEHYYSNAKSQTNGEYWECPDESDYVITQNTEYEVADRILRAFYGFFVTYDNKNEQQKLLHAKAYKGDNKNEKFKIKGGYIK